MLQGYSPGCAENRRAVLEFVADELVIPMTPIGSQTLSRNVGLFSLLKLYAKPSCERRNYWLFNGISAARRLGCQPRGASTFCSPLP